MENYSHTARDILLEEEGCKLTCVVEKVGGGYRERQGIYLDKIQNSNGVLVYRKLALVPFESVGVARIDCF